MDPIEIFELAAYVIDATQSDPAGSAFLSEIRPYVVQAARSPNTIFLTEIRSYVIFGNATDRLATHSMSAYAITKQIRGAYHTNENVAAQERTGGVVYNTGTQYTIESAPNSNALGTAAVRLIGDGVLYRRGTLYTVEIP